MDRNCWAAKAKKGEGENNTGNEGKRNATKKKGGVIGGLRKWPPAGEGRTDDNEGKERSMHAENIHKAEHRKTK